jgi:hypothetical protein
MDVLNELKPGLDEKLYERAMSVGPAACARQKQKVAFPEQIKLFDCSRPAVSGRYERAMVIELRRRGHVVEAQQELPVFIAMKRSDISHRT